MGRRGANQTAVFFAALGALCCGLSNSLEMLIAARFVSIHVFMTAKEGPLILNPLKLSGIGGGGVFTTATVITSDMYSLRDRSLMQGFSSLFNGVRVFMGLFKLYSHAESLTSHSGWFGTGWSAWWMDQ
jgi:MFS family permease